MRHSQLFVYVFVIAFIYLKSVNSFSTTNVHVELLFGGILSNCTYCTQYCPNRQAYDKYPVAMYGTLGAGIYMVCNSPPEERKSCTINVKKLNYNHALIIDPTDHTKFLYPNENGLITFTEGDPVFLSCPGKNNFLKHISKKAVTLTCFCDKIFKLGEIPYDFDRLDCKKAPAYYIEPETIKKSSKETYYNIGFITDKRGDFLKLMRILYNDESNTFWSRAIISRYLAGSQKTPKNRRFNQQYYSPNVNADDAYKVTAQTKSLDSESRCTNNEDTHCSFVKVENGAVLNQGHLTPKSSFIYTSAGVATFSYLNTAPQWKVVYETNWGLVEEHVNKMAVDLRRDLIVYTGTLWQFHLRDWYTKKLLPGFLYSKENTKKIVIPEFFWKLVYDPEEQKGIVYVTLNNPYAQDPTNYNICSDPKTKINGALSPKNWRPTIINKGFSYMCSVPDFVKFNNLSFDDFDARTVTKFLYIDEYPQIKRKNRDFDDE